MCLEVEVRVPWPQAPPIHTGCDPEVLCAPFPIYRAAHAECRALGGGTQASVEASVIEIYWGF